MGLFSRKPEPKGYQPTNAEIDEAGKQLANGSHHAAWDLTLHSGDYSQQTAMRILGATVDHTPQD
ncbi:hypothetical protein [Streptomyces wuyuanensis]|uniref:Uncharacterized protein n=1 Tax=Streptomyces wuyuanensis TaxID=1196353 RepID=A0A1G9ZA23_9ACTN|nr:hypothetical protein [Streptomyces wuyuanensis]SDN18229.1 hypothetical protein SAMN05444921_12146 [Streptomyces wuyuanensis]